MSESNPEIQELEIKPVSNDLRSELKSTFDPLFSTLGHGTRLEAAKQIIEQGLRAKNNDLYSTTIPLFDGSKTYEEQIDSVISKLEHRQHLDLKAIVILMIPNPSEEDIGGGRYFNSVFEELPEEDNGYSNRFLIPQKYIRGYIDIKKNQFVSNPNFNPEKLNVKSTETFKILGDKNTLFCI